MAGEEIRITRLAMQVLGDAPTGISELRITRLALQVLGDAPIGDPEVRITRLAMQVLGDGPTNPSPVRITKYDAEVLSKTTPQPLRVTRYTAEVLSDSPKPAFRMSRIFGEVLSSRGSSLTSADVSTAQAFFMHNWGRTARMETSFNTSVSFTIEKGAEERVMLLDKPSRTLSVQWNPDLLDGFRDFIFDAMRQGFEQLPVPLYMDYVPLTGATTGNFIPCSPYLRRFFGNGRIALFSWKAGRATAIQYLTIDRTDINGIHTNETISPGFDGEHDIVVPMVLSEISLRGTFKAATDQLVDSPFSFDEVIGATALPAAASGLPENFEIYDGIPILNVAHNWLRSPLTGFSRMGSKYTQGKAVSFSLYGERPAMTQRFSLLLDTRQAAWDMIRFLESRRGRLLPFWIIGHFSLWTPTASTASSIDVSPESRVQNLQDFLGHVAMVMADGSTVVREVTSVTESGDWTINLTPDLPVGFSWANIEKMTWAAKARNAKDSYSEEWFTTDTCEIKFDAVELLDERNIDTPDLTGSTTILPATSHLLLVSVDPTISTT